MADYDETRSQPPQVFLSYRGAELPQSFVAHLEVALRRSGVNVYVDNVALKGKGLALGFEGINESRIALVIFSKRYTESRWCLDELVKITKQVKYGKLMAIPIYYDVKVSVVERLDGDFGSNLWNHAKGNSEFYKLKQWKKALDFISQTVGLSFTEKSSESVFINDIIFHVHDLLRSDDGLTLRRDDGVNLRRDDDDDDDDADDDDDDDDDSAEDNTVNEEMKQQNVIGSSTMVTYDKTQPKQKVFISFSRTELRSGFIRHLLGALTRKGVSFYIEGDEWRGEDLGSLSFKRIEESMIALVIFSSRYTESAWCLDELVKIKELMDESKLVAVPLFYMVEPSQIKELEGEFGDSFRDLCSMNRESRVIKWMEALESVASKKGIYLKEQGSESEIVYLTVMEVLKIILQREKEIPSLFPSAEKGKSTELPSGKGEKHETYLHKYPLFGMEQRMEQLRKKLEFDCDDTRIIGVVGMPGIGKTTLAMMLYEEWKYRFIRSASLLGIRKMSEACGSVRLQETLWEHLLEGNFPVTGDQTMHESMLAELRKNKIFVVLDDVSDKHQLMSLLGRDWIKEGSMIVITTCDKSLVEGFVDDTYVVPKLNDREAFRLFSYHAFGEHIHSRGGTFLTLSRMFVDYAEGHPLALKLLGSELYGKDEAYWASKLETITESSSVMFQDDWRLFTDQLNEKQKDVFLDIVCFFKSEDEYFVRSLLDSGDPDSTDAVSEVKDLVNKFLIRIADGRVEMNVPLCTFSKDLASPRWLRLWNYEDIISELKQKSDANNVRGIFLDMSKLTTSMWLEPLTFINMRNLRYMKIYDSCCPRQCEADCKFNCPEGFKFPLEEVRYLHWLKFPLKELPVDFRPENLVDLSLPYSNITQVWEGEKDTPRLKWVDLSYSSELLDLSALSKAENLQRLNLEGCTSLKQLPAEIQNMKSLVCLNLRGCISLWSLPKMNLISLQTLILSDCSNLDEFELISESIEFLHLDGTAIKRLPPAIQKLQRLVVLNLKNCKRLRCLPNSLGNLKALEKLILSGCSRLANLPDVRNSLRHLQVLLFDGTGAKEMPSTSCFTVSEGTASADMFLQPQGSHCSVRDWPCGVSRVSSLRHLCLSRSDFVSLQPDIWKLYNLKWLDVKYCENLIYVPLLPPRLQYFDAHGCVSLERVANPIAFPVLSDQIHATFNFSNCKNLDQDAKDDIVSYTQWRSQLVLDELTRYNGGLVFDVLIGTCVPGWEVPAWFSHRAAGSVLKRKLHLHWSDNKFTGIGLSAVIVFDGNRNQGNRVVVKCNCEFKNEDGSTYIRFSRTVGGWSEPSSTRRNIVSSHVLVGFTSRIGINKISDEYDDEKCVCTEAIIKFEVTDGVEEIKGCEVVKCGFTLVYAPEERFENISGTEANTQKSGQDNSWILSY